MTSPQTSPVPNSSSLPQLRAIQLTSAAIVIGSVMISVVRILVEPEPVAPSWPAVGLVVLVIVATWVVITLVGYSAPALPLGLPRENAVATSLRFFGSTTVLRSALCEVPVIVAFAVSFAVPPRSWLPLLIALPVTLALFWWHAWPSPRTAAAVEKGLESEGAESHLSETLGFH